MYFYGKFKKMPREYKNTHQLEGLRNLLIEGLRNKGIKSEAVLNAMLKIPRHFFIPEGFELRAYEDNAFPIAAEQTISQPYTVAFQTELLDLKPMDKVLEIGTGSGYQTSVLSELNAKVFTIERQRELFKPTQAFLNLLGYRPHCFLGDGYEGLPTYAPFDKVLITAGAEIVPEKLVQQLKIGGVLVAPIGPRDKQTMIRLKKMSETETHIEKFGNFVFVPMLKGINK